MRRNGPLALAFHTLFVVFVLAPIVAVALVSFTDKGYISLPFGGASLRWFRAILDNPDFVDAFKRSVLLAASAATLGTAIAIPTGLAVVRYQFTGRQVILAAIMSPLMIPNVVLGIAFLRFYTELGVTGTWWGLALAHVVVVLPYALRLVISAATGIDRDSERAACSLGASPFTVFRRVTLPLILPGVSGGWFIAYITSFDELTMSVFVASASTQTLPVRMYHHIVHTIDPLIASISTVLVVLTLVVMVVLDRLYGLDRVLVGNK
jgi:putative spermidine/putrescine transport system permease protein